MARMLPPETLLAIVATQNDIASAALDLDAVMSLVVERARTLTGARASVIELADGEEMVYHVASGAAAGHVGMRLSILSSLSGLCIREGRALLCTDALTDPRVDAEACRRVGALSMVCVPLCHRERVIGVLKVYDPAIGAFNSDDVETLELLSGVIAAQMAHAADFALHRHESRHDGLTGLGNRRAFDERLAAELARTERHGGELTLCLLDLDRFKPVNDRQGHGAGDAVLRAVAGQLREMRGEDEAFRVGGDEFALILAHSDLDGAATAIQRLAAAIAADPASLGVGVSIGVAAFQPGDTVHMLMARADLELYEAKRSSVR